MECSICCETLTKVTKKQIKCPTPDCTDIVCAKCFKRYIEQSNDITPKCMFCNKDIAYSNIRSALPIAWSNGTYLDIRTNHLLSRERSLLPASQNDVKSELERRERMRQINEIQDRIRALADEIKKLEQDKIRIYTRRRRRVETNVINHKCIVETCNGFLENNWKCGICSTEVCSSCGVRKESNEHECDENTKLSFQTIQAETRPCPKCAVPIHKWEGCNQMYCTLCGCMFDYRTGRLETGFFHNPHYFEALEAGTITRRNDNHNQNGCDFNDYDFIDYIRWIESDGTSCMGIQNILGLIRHIDQIMLPKYLPNTMDEECRGMRVKYLLNELSEEQWIKRLKVLEKRREKNKEIYQLMELFKDVGNDVTINIMELYKKTQAHTNYDRTSDQDSVIEINGVSINPIEQVLSNITEIQKMTEYINEKFFEMAKQFNSLFPFIDKTWKRRNCYMI